MARFSIDQEIDDFQLFLNSIMPWGVHITEVDKRYEPVTVPGTPTTLVATATVVDVGLVQQGAVYQVAFGPGDTFGPGALDETEPRNAWTLVLSDPIVDLRDGRYAVEILTGEGASYDPERWLLLNPSVGPADLTSIERNP